MIPGLITGALVWALITLSVTDWQAARKYGFMVDDSAELLFYCCLLGGVFGFIVETVK